MPLNPNFNIELHFTLMSKLEENMRGILVVLDTMSMQIVKAEEMLKEHIEQMKIVKPEEQLEKLEGELKKQWIEITGVPVHVQILNEHVDNHSMKEVQLYLDDVNPCFKNACSQMVVGLKKMIQEDLICRPSLGVS